MPTKLDNRREIELAEGVHIHLRPVGIYPRLLARLIDATAMALLMTLLAVLFGLAGLAVGAAAGQGLYQLVAFFLIWFYDPLWEASKYSATPGKLALGLKVVRRSGAPVGFASGFLRVLLFWIDVLPGFGTVGMVAILSSRNSQRLGDMVADTLVIYSKPPHVPHIPALKVPATRPGMRLQREEQLAFLQFAERSDRLNPERLAEIAAPLAVLEGARTSPSPETFALGVAQWLTKNEE